METSGEVFQVQVRASSILQSYFKIFINGDADPEPKQQQDVPVLILIDDQCLFNSGSAGVCFLFRKSNSTLGVKGCKGDLPFKSDLPVLLEIAQ